MARNTKHWLWLLLFTPVIFLFWRTAGQMRDHPITGAATPAPDGQVGTERATLDVPRRVEPAPSYVLFSEARLQVYHQDFGYVLTGKVISEQGEGLPGAIVSLYGAKAEFPKLEWPAPLLSQTCDIEGRYTLRLRSPMHAYVTVRKEGYTPKEEEIEILDPGIIQRNHCLLPAPACVEGHVLDQVGRPISGAFVSAIIDQVPTSFPGSRYSPIGQKTDSSGKFVIRGLREGRVNIAATSEREFGNAKFVSVTAGDCQRVDFQLAEGRIFSFVVKNLRGEPIPHPQACERFGNDDQGNVSALVRAQPVRLPCLVSAVGYKSRTILLDPNAPPTEVVLEDADVLKGRVVNEWGQPIAAARVKVEAKTVETDKEGRFSVAVSTIIPSGMSFRVSKPGYIEQNIIPGYSEQLGDYSGSPLTEVEIRMKRVEGGIYGRVIDAAGNPTRRFRVALMAASGPLYTRDFENDGGVFFTQDVPAGTYSLTILPVPYSSQEEIQSLKLDNVEIRKGYIYGKIVARFSSPVEKK